MERHPRADTLGVVVRRRRHALGWGATLVSLAFALVAVSTAAALPPNFRDTVAISGLTEPTQVRFAPNGKVYVAEKSGIVKELDSLDDPTPRQVADLRTNVHNYWDRGLLGLAVDPDGTTVYVAYTYDREPGNPTIPRWGTGQASDDCRDRDPTGNEGCPVSGRLSRIDVATGTETPLVEDWCQQYPSQSVGEVNVGSDGYLYLVAGDGAAFFNGPPNNGGPDDPRLNVCGDPPSEGGQLRGQDWRTTGDPLGLGGSAIRVDRTTGYGVPGNPGYTSNGNNNRSRIIGYGFRNPYRSTLRPGTSDLYIGDVGQGSREAIKRIPTPASAQPLNFGWGCYEGSVSLNQYSIPLCDSLYPPGGSEQGTVTFPFFEYRHDSAVVTGDGCPLNLGAAIAGLAFAPGTGEYPALYRGALFFADYARRCIWYMEPGAGGVPDPARMRFFGATVASGDYAGPVDLEFGPGGDLFYVDLVPGTSTGAVRRIRYFAGNQPPIVQASVANPDPPLGAPVQFSSTGSSDPDALPGETLTYAWDLDGDGQFDDSTQAEPAFTYTSGNWTANSRGNVNVRLRITDALAVATTSGPVEVRPGNRRPVATIDAPGTSLRWSAGQGVSFGGRASDADEQLAPASMSWSVILQHCPSGCHVHTVQGFSGVTGGSFTMPDHELPYHLELTLTVTDARGATDVKTVRLDPRAVRVRIQSDPPGVPLTLDGASSSEPLERTLVAGTPRAISAPEAYGDLRFDGWSDGGASSHSVTPTEDTTLVARYRGPTAPPPAVLPGLPPSLDRTPPRLSVAAKRRQPALRTRVVRVAARCPDEACTARATGALKVGARASGAKAQSAARRALAGQRVTLAVRLSAKALKAARRAAGSRRRVTFALSIVAKDAAGNRTTARRTVELVR